MKMTGDTALAFTAENSRPPPVAPPRVRFASVTQFVGFIPVGRAPDHFHTYDEVIYILQGDGALHIDGETAPRPRAGTSACSRRRNTAAPR